MLAGTYRKYRPFAVCGGWWLGGGDGFEVEFAAGRVDHGGEVVRVAEAAGPSLHVCFVKFLWAVSAFLLVRLSGCF